MATINKVTELRLAVPITEATIQTHIDEQNSDGWYLVAVDSLIGWYRFFWAKQV